MGVTGLWTVVQPCARPIKIETLNRKRLAVDASIWIYQFLKAVRDKEGNALRNSHVVGFFRRICKLLFIGIQPVFVFDGGAPILKRQTVTSRKARREGRREDAVRTAGKLLAVQMQRKAEEEEQRRKDQRPSKRRAGADEAMEATGPPEEEVPDNPVYVDELQMTVQERQQNRTFRKKDAYHLPNLDVDLSNLGAPNDPRIMSHEELEEYARQFHTGEDVNVYDFSKIDFESVFFQSLPASDRYNILNAARLRSRLRMGYSKEQLDTMFPNRMDFSRFQIERVKERNELTQRLMNINGMNGEDAMLGINDGGRVAGEKGKEYVLVKNDGVEGGWALGVVSNKHEGQRNQPIDVDQFERRGQEAQDSHEEADDSGEDGFEDVPIEGLNRLPRQERRFGEDVPFDSEALTEKRQALYKSRQTPSQVPTAAPRNDAEANSDLIDDPDALFVNPDISLNPAKGDEEDDALFEDVPVTSLDADMEEEDDLQRAIAMSLEQEDQENDLATFTASAKSGPRIDQPLDFNVKNAKAGREFAHLANSRAQIAARRPFGDESDDEDAYQSPKSSPRKVHTGPRVHGFKRDNLDPSPSKTNDQPKDGKTASETHRANPSIQPYSGFNGPLPFESLSLGKSILGAKKPKKKEGEPLTAGGFEKEDDRERTPQPLPPWFSGDVRDDVARQKAIEERTREEEKKKATEEQEARRKIDHEFSVLHREETAKIVDLDQTDDRDVKVVHVDSDAEDGQDEELEEVNMGSGLNDQEKSPATIELASNMSPPRSTASSSEGMIRSSLTAEKKIAEQTDQSDTPLSQDLVQPSDPDRPDDSTINLEEENIVLSSKPGNSLQEGQDHKAHLPKPAQSEQGLPADEDTRSRQSHGEEEDDDIAWSDSEQGHDNEESESRQAGGKVADEVTSSSKVNEKHDEDRESRQDMSRDALKDSRDLANKSADKSRDSPIFTRDQASSPAAHHPSLLKEETEVMPLANLQEEDLDDFSDPEEAELMRQLATEAEEHARFASSLNAKSYLENAEDYEKELRQLRNQQKKDRRDADEVTHIMVTECQQLLRLFGLPYVTAPMEAEAQCAELVTLGLVDGIVTDDSDIFLFGGTRVYKNMFNQAKFVECYLSSDLEREYSLTRHKLIQFAHLLGSDYTEGLPSVGPVTALEILSEFDTLDAFASWWTAVQATHKPSDADKANSFRRKFRKNASKLFLPTTFPDKRVDAAYLHPEVDKDPEPFQWGVPDLDALRSFLMATIGWSQERTDEVLVPVIRDMNRRDIEGTQANITQFFSGGVGVGAGPRHLHGTGTAGAGSAKDGARAAGDGAFAPRRRGDGKSKRMESALGKLHHKARGEEVPADREASQSQPRTANNPSLDNESHSTAAAQTTTKRARTARSTKKVKRKANEKRPTASGDKDASTIAKGNSNDGEDDDLSDAYEPPKKERKRARAKND